MARTITLRRDYLRYISKYRRYEKRHKTLSAHCSPCFATVKEGDVVTVGQCRCVGGGDWRGREGCESADRSGRSVFVVLAALGAVQGTRGEPQ